MNPIRHYMRALGLAMNPIRRYMRALILVMMAVITIMLALILLMMAVTAIFVVIALILMAVVITTDVRWGKTLLSQLNRTGSRDRSKARRADRRFVLDKRTLSRTKIDQ